MSLATTLKLLAAYGDGNAAQVSSRMQTLILELSNLIDNNGLLKIDVTDGNASGQLALQGGPFKITILPPPTTFLNISSSPAGVTVYSYRITALTSSGESLPSTQQILSNNTPLTATSNNTITWSHVAGANSYNVYGRTTGAELLMATILWDRVSAKITWVDNGTVNPAGALPTLDTTGAIKIDGQLYLPNSGGANGWKDPIKLGTAFMWISSDNKLRIKATAPTSDLDGAEPNGSTGSTLFSASAPAGTANAQSFTTDGLGALSATSKLILVTPALSNTATMSIAFDANAAVPVRSPLGNPLNANEWAAGITYLMRVTNVTATILVSGATW